MTHLYLIRHAEAIAAVQDMIGDTALTPLGITQAEHLRDRLAATHEITADVLIASTFLRAKQTAEIIAPALGLPIVWDDEVQELRPGEADGMHVQEARKKFGDVDFEQNPFQQVAPGGENWGQFMLRVGTALDRIIRQHEGKTIVVVCHGGVIDGSFLHFFKMGTLHVPPIRFYTHNTSITHWQKEAFFQERGRPPHWRLIKYNDDMHMRDIGSQSRIPWEKIYARPRTGADQPQAPLPTE
jgi:2,3-bisphosphoglycerate-dependent phosphoglycerate mutase